jgi:hypothetical protein
MDLPINNIPGRCPLLELPQELKGNIYRYALHKYKATAADNKEPPLMNVSADMYELKDKLPNIRLHQTCSTICDEVETFIHTYAYVLSTACLPIRGVSK